MKIYAWARQVSICCAEKYCLQACFIRLRQRACRVTEQCWAQFFLCRGCTAGSLLLLLLSPQLCQAFVHNPLLFGCAALGSVSITPAAELRIKRVFQVEECQSARIPLFPAASPASNPWPQTSPSLPPNYMQISPNKWVLSTWQPVSLRILKRPDG